MKLHLDNNNFNNILWKFQKIDTLEFVSLNDNVIDSKLPFEIDEYLSNLKFSYLTRNYFKGNILISFSLLKKLKVVDISKQLNDNCSNRHNLTGSLLSFSSSPKSCQLKLGYNCLTGSIPEDFL